MTERRLRHILLVDDNSDDNFIHERAIRKSGLGASVAVCRDGQDALDYLQGVEAYADAEVRHPELVLLDINMPRVNGWEFLAEFTKLGQAIRQGVVIVMLSTSTNPTDRGRADEFEQVVDYMSKPLTPDLIRQLVTAHFDAEPTS